MQRFRLGAATDVFSPDVAAAAREMRTVGLHGAELRTINGRNILEAGQDEVEGALAALRENKLEVVAIASPLLKCSLDEWKTQSQHVDRVFDIANLAGARISGSSPDRIARSPRPPSSAWSTFCRTCRQGRRQAARAR